MSRRSEPLTVILTHEHADFDAVSSQVGLARLMPGAVPVLPQQVNENVMDFLVLYGRELPLVGRDELPRRAVDHAWMVDTRSAQAVRGMTPQTERSLLDHHAQDVLGSHEEWKEYQVEAVGATATLICERMRAEGLMPPPIEASLLLTGIHEDTGSLTYAATTARDARAVAWLMEAGADVTLAARFLHPPLSGDARALYRELVDGAEVHEVDGSRIVVAHASASGFEETVSGIVQRVMEALAPDALLALIDLGEHVQLVGRSASDHVDVGAVARAFGGGGHSRASAAVIRDGLSAAKERLVARLDRPEVTRPVDRVAGLMSSTPIRTVDADDPAGEALTMARRYGHEGFPVLDEGEVIGLITRATLDLAEHHHLQNRPVRELISGPPPTVEPEDSIAHLQRVMTEHDAGQIPVVQDGRLLGIVTRTDLLAHFHRRQRALYDSDMQIDLSEHVDDSYLRALRDIGELVEQRDEQAYIVGGLPRDALMGRPNRTDVDVVVVGDAAELARALASSRGGEAVEHGRFGTAKWTRDGVVIDLVSARAEYYTEPGALPTVTSGSLRADLRRRDFPINTLAVDISGERFGRVIDLFGGLDDIAAKRIRVLHGLSFVEDPTRILRAVRFENRLGFRMDRHTEQLARGAVSWLGEISGARVAAELEQLFTEPSPADALARMRALTAASAIHDRLRVDERSQRVVRAFPAAWSWWRSTPAGGQLADHDPERTMFLAWLAGQSDGGVATSKHLRLPRADRDALSEAQALREGPLTREDIVPDSVLHREASTRRPRAVFLAWLLAEHPNTRERLRRYATAVAGIEPPLRGDDLLAIGAPPGPVFGDVLAAVRDAHLDGEVVDRDDALALARDLLRAHGVELERSSVGSQTVGERRDSVAGSPVEPSDADGGRTGDG